jgi:hypothetical protein
MWSFRSIGSRWGECRNGMICNGGILGIQGIHQVLLLLMMANAEDGRLFGCHSPSGTLKINNLNKLDKMSYIFN